MTLPKSDKSINKAVSESNSNRSISSPQKSADMKKERNRDNETREKLSKLAGVGHDTYSKGVDVLKSDNEKLCGIRQGSAGRVSLEADNRPLTLDAIAKELGCSVTQLKDIKRLQTLSPEYLK